MLLFNRFCLLVHYGTFRETGPLVLSNSGSVPDVDKDESGHNLLRELHLTLSGCNGQGFLGGINPVWERNGNFYTTESKRREE